MTTDDRDGLQAVFREEATEMLNEFEEALLLLEGTPEDRSLVDRLFRAAHTLKGNSAMFGLDALSELAHGLESLLGKVREGAVGVDQALIDTLLREADVLKGMVREACGLEPGHGKKAAAPVAEAVEATIRVNTEKVDRLVDLVGELVITQSMVSQLVGALTPQRFATLQEMVAKLDRNCRELQERVLNVRMLPVGSVFSRFPRLVRDTAAVLGKQVALEMIGQETELDRTVLEKIGDPLTHLLRNAVDHGIEDADERMAAGKMARGCIRLSAYQKGGNIYIEVEDDGRGLDRARIGAKAIERGLCVRPEGLADDEIFALVFEPGFSTAASVTELSGRGVGMDVVRKNVEALKGSISITSAPGQGTCFRMKLPLTLAIIDGLSLKVSDRYFIVPLSQVVELLRPAGVPVRRVSGAGEVVEVRGELFHLVRLHELCRTTPAGAGMLAVLDDGATRLAALVDDVIGECQLVVKSIESNCCAVPGVSGAAILGNGEIGLLLDPSSLAAAVRGASAGASQ